jgi:hypothetical protein
MAGDECHQGMLLLPRQYGRAASFDSTRAAQLYMVSVAGTWPAFPDGWPVRRGVVAVGLGRCRPRGVGNVGEVWSVADGRRAQRAWLSGVGSCVCGPLPPACVHSRSRPTRPCTRPAESGQFWYVWVCSRLIPSRSLVPAHRRRVMGNSLGGHSTRYTNGMFVGQGRWRWRGGRLVPSRNGSMSPRHYGRAPSFGSTRAAQFVRVSVAGTWPASHGGWPVRRGVRAISKVVVAPACAHQGREVVSVGNSWRAAAGMASKRSSVHIWPANGPRASIHPAAQPAHQA